MPSVYFDASVIVSLFVADAFSARADAFVAAAQPTPIVSDFAAAEVAATIGIWRRRGGLTSAQAADTLIKFDLWRAATTRCELTSGDVATAEVHVRRIDLTLRAPDALHLAMTQRLGAPLATFDVGLAAAAKALKLGIADA